MVRKLLNGTKKIVYGLLVAAFWIGVWHVAALWVGRELFLPAPKAVWDSLVRLVPTKEFWQTVYLSLLRVLYGYVPGVVAGVIGGVITAKVKFLDRLLSPVLTVIRATPVTSFILLVWFIFGRDDTPTFIVTMMVLPIVWANVAEGVKTVDPSLKEVCKVYRLSFWRRLRILYIPHCIPYFSAGVLTSLGFAWKAGIAAEVICTPRVSIGEMVYDAKVYMEMADLFAWTVVVILLSLMLEWILKFLLGRGKRRASDS